jgi:hypothetical protein
MSVVYIYIVISWVMTLFILVDSHHHFMGMCCLHVQDVRVELLLQSVPKVTVQ